VSIKFPFANDLTDPMCWLLAGRILRYFPGPKALNRFL